MIILPVYVLLNVGIAFGSSKYDKASQQTSEWASRHVISNATNEQGILLPSLTASLGIGKTGPLLLQDLNLQELLASMAQERIPERVVHAKGAGAFGYFQVTNPDISRYTEAKVFQPGTKTRVAVRFSTNKKEFGSADSVSDLRGFAVKFYTDDGNYDLLLLNTPNFNIRDPMLFPAIQRSRKRNPVTHLQDNEMYWDFTAARPEATFQTFLLFSDLTYPRNYRHMSARAVHTFKFTGGNVSEPVFVRFHLISNQGKKISSAARYLIESGKDQDYFVRDLYNAISRKQFPSWILNVQILTQKQIDEYKHNAFDSTKILPVKEFPLVPIGKLVLNRNPNDYFNEVEQIAFNPGRLVPGIDTGSDHLLQGRIFAYNIAHLHRLGKNFNQLPINSPRSDVPVNTYTRNGFANIHGNGDGGPNYFPNTFNGPIVDPSAIPPAFYQKGGKVDRHDSGNEDNYVQLRNYFNDEMSPAERKRSLKAITNHLSLASPRVQALSLERNWDPVGEEFSKQFRAELSKANARNTKRARKNA